jgi:hypothetical protein
VPSNCSKFVWIWQACCIHIQFLRQFEITPLVLCELQKICPRDNLALMQAPKRHLHALQPVHATEWTSFKPPKGRLDNYQQNSPAAYLLSIFIDRCSIYTTFAGVDCLSTRCSLICGCQMGASKESQHSNWFRRQIDGNTRIGKCMRQILRFGGNRVFIVSFR